MTARWSSGLRETRGASVLVSVYWCSSEAGGSCVRAIAEVPKTFRFASTAPFYVEVGDRLRTVHRADVTHFLRWIDERIAALEGDRGGELVEPARKSAVLEPHREARRFFERLLRVAE